MTNSEIILANRVFLTEQDVIKGVPGTALMWKDEQGEREIQMPEEILTVKEWNKRGFWIKKGEHAIAKFQIWMPKRSKAKAGAEEDAEAGGDDAEMQAKGFYKKVAYFFTADQVSAKEERK